MCFIVLIKTSIFIVFDTWYLYNVKIVTMCYVGPYAVVISKYWSNIKYAYLLNMGLKRIEQHIYLSKLLYFASQLRIFSI